MPRPPRRRWTPNLRVVGLSHIIDSVRMRKSAASRVVEEENLRCLPKCDAGWDANRRAEPYSQESAPCHPRLALSSCKRPALAIPKFGATIGPMFRRAFVAIFVGRMQIVHRNNLKSQAWPICFLLPHTSLTQEATGPSSQPQQLCPLHRNH